MKHLKGGVRYIRVWKPVLISSRNHVYEQQQPNKIRVSSVVAHQTRTCVVIVLFLVQVIFFVSSRRHVFTFIRLYKEFPYQ
jgi:hypothetical protein